MSDIPPPPWATPQGRACIDRWVSVSMAKLNAYDGGAQFNGRKPWSINQYGLLEGRRPAGPFSVAAPDNFRDFGNDRYAYMWANWVPSGPGGFWRYPEWNAAGVEPLQPFVLKCLAGG